MRWVRLPRNCKHHARVAGLLLCASLYSSVVVAGPGSGQVVAGQGNIKHPDKTTTVVNQRSDRLIVDWSSFNVAPNETVQFKQPSVSAAALNRILSQSPSQILGNIMANGQVYLLNPNGIVFGKTATVNVGGLFATGLNISDSDFMSGKLKFAAPDGQDGGYVINHGVLQAADGGSINLIGSSVFNDGIIMANLGQVNMAAGSAVTVDFDSDGLMRFAVSAPVLHKMADAQSGAAVTNAGKIIASGGNVVMTGAVAEQVLMQAANNTGLVQAQGIQNRNGHIYLTGSGGDVINSGTLDASNSSGIAGTVVMQSTGTTALQGNGVINVSSVAGQGGTAQMLGAQVGLLDNSAINASGGTGGGYVMAGGDFHGANPSVQDATKTYVSPHATINADAIQSGNGGKVAVWANDTTQFYGSISARGGANGGNGGFVETSGKGLLDYQGTVDATAPYGKMGTLLLDPTNIYIALNQADATVAGMTGTDNSANTGSGGNPNNFAAFGAVQDSLLTTAALDAALGTANVDVTTTNPFGTGAGNITVVDPIAWSSANTLTLTAANNVAINAGITTGVAGSALILNAAGNITQNAAGIISGSGGLIQNGTGVVTLSQANTYTGLTTINAGTLQYGANDVISTGAVTVNDGGTLNLVGYSDSIGALTVNSGATGGTVTTGAGTLTLTGNITSTGGDSNALISGNLAFAATRKVSTTNAADGLTISAVIGGAGGLTKAGAGTLTLSGANTYTGATTVNAGVIDVQNNTALGTAAGATTVASGAAVQIDGSGLSIAEPITLVGTGVLSGGALLNLANTNTWSGAITLGASGATINSDGGLLTLSGGIVGGGNPLTLAGIGNITESGVISGAGTTLTMNGTGTLTLSAANTYTGATTINAGTLADGIANALPTVTNLTVTSPGALDLAGFNQTVVNVTGTGTVTDSGAVATFTVNNAGVDTFAGTLAGALALIKQGTGTFTLSGPNTYTGATNINSGILSITNSGALGTASNTSDTTVASGAVLQMSNNITTTNAGTLILNGTGTGQGALVNVSGNNTWNSNVMLGSNTTIYSATAGATLTIGNASYGTTPFTMGSNTVTIAGPGNTWFNSNVGVSGDTGGLVMNGTGLLTFYGANTYYTGATHVNAGTLILEVGPFSTGWYGINGSLTIGTGTGTTATVSMPDSYANQISPNSAVTINSDGILNVNSASGATTSVGTLTLNGGKVNIATGITAAVTGNLTSNANSAHQTSLISGGALKLVTGNISVARDATLASDLTISSAIGGTTITKTGNGILTFSGVNTYTGTTTISAGTLSVQNAAALGSAAAGTTVGAGATLDINNVAVGTEALTLNGTGVGGAGALTATGVASLAGTVTLGSASTIGGTGALTLSGAIAGGSNTLTLAGAGTGTFTGTVTAGTLNLNKVAGGNVTFSNNVTVGAGGLSTSANNFNITFTGATNSFTGAATFSNTGVGSTVTLVSGAGTSTFTGGVDTSAGPAMTDIGGTLATSGTLMNLGATTLTAATTLNAGAGNIAFNSTLDGGFALAANSSGITTFSGIVGGVASLASITTDVPGTTAINGGAVATTGMQTYDDNVTLGAPTSLTTTNSDITTAGAVNAGSNALTLSAGTGNLSFANSGNSFSTVTIISGNNGSLNNGANALTLGSGTHLGNNLTLTSGALSFGTTTVGGNLSVTTTGAIAQTGALTVTGTTTLAAGATNNITLNNVANAFTGAMAVTSGHNVSLTNNRATVLGNSTISGTLGVTSNGAISQAAGASLAVNGAGQTSFSSGAAPIALTNSGNSFAGPVSLATTGSGQNAAIQATSGTLTLSAPGGINVSGSLSAADLNDIILGSNITTAGSSGQSYSGPVKVATAVTLDTSAGNGSIGFDPLSSLDSLGATPQTLVIDAGTGNVTFGAAVGGTSALASLKVTGSSFILGNSITTTGSQIYNGSVQLGGATTLTTGGTAGANIQFESLVSGLSNNLTLNAGANGSITETGTGAITGTGVVTLTGRTINLSGLTNNLGTLVVSNGSIGNSAVQVANQGKLILGMVSLEGGSATITTGTGLALSGSLSDTSGSGSATLTLNIDANGAGANADFSVLTNTSITGFAAGKIAVTGSSSASDTLLGPNDNEVWNITGSNAGNFDSGIVVFSNFSNLTGGSNNDSFTLSGTGNISGVISGGGGVDTLTGNNLTNTWDITGTNTGILTDSNGSNHFSGISNLTGGTGDDDFVFDNGQGVSGTVDGGAGGVNTLDFKNYTTAVGVTLTGSNAFGYSGTTAGSPNPTGGFAEMTAIDLPALSNTLNLNDVSSTVLINSSVASDLFNLTLEQSGVPNLTFGNVSVVNGGTGAGVSNTLASNEATANTWTLTAADGGSYYDDQTLGFSNFADLSGGSVSGSDNFVLAGGSVVSITGGGGVNTLTGDNSGDHFTISAANTGNITGLVAGFTNIQNLTGGNGNDTFMLSGTGHVSGLISGGGGSDTLVGNNLTNVWAISAANAGTLTDANGSNSFAGITNLTGGSGTDTLTGIAGGSNWGLTGANAVNVSGMHAISMEALVGGTGNDTFTLASGVHTFNGAITGGGGVDTLVATDGSNVWAISGANAGSLNTTTLFSGIINLTGGSGVDGFTLSGTGHIGELISGGGGVDTLAGNNLTNTWAISGSNSGTLTDSNGSDHFTGISNLTGGAAADTFTLSGSGNISGVISGGGGVDTLTGNNLANAWAITGANAGTLTDSHGSNSFSGISNLTGGTGDDDFVFDNGQGVTGTVDGGAGGVNILDFSAYTTAVGITLSGSNAFGYSGSTAGSPNPTDGFAQITQIDEPGSLSNTLTLQNGIAGTVTINSSTPINFFNLTVNVSGAPNLVFSNIGTVNGGSGASNTLISGEGSNNTWTLTSANSGSYNDGQDLTFTNFGTLIDGSGNDNFMLAGGRVTSIDGGAGSNTLTGDNSGDSFTISAASGGNITGRVTGYSNIQNLTGGAGNDTFTLTGTGHISGVISGGGGSDTLVGNNLTNAWAISAASAGTLTDANGSNSFAGITNLTGGSGNDHFVFITGGSIGGNLVGGGGTDILDYSGLAGSVNVALTSVSGGLGTGTGTMIGGTFSGIGILKGSASGTDVLIGPNQSNNWQITGANTGNVDGFQFSSIENLTGGSSTNAFVLNGGSLSGNINGGSGAAAGNSLQAANGSNTWTITGSNQGTVTGISGSFSRIGNLIGGASADDFIFANSATLSGTLNGSSGNDTLDWSTYVTARHVTITGPGTIDGMQGTEASIAGGFNNITNMAGASGLLNSLTGPNSVNTWNVTASNTGNLDGALSFSNFQTLTGGSGADTFNLGAGVSGSIDGGGGIDTANIVNSFTAPASILTINNIGTIADSTGATITAATLAISGASSIGSASHPLLGNFAGLQIRASNGNAFISTGSVDLQGINLGSGSLTLASGGVITDVTGQNVTADTLDLAAVTGIGIAAAPIKTVINTLNAAVNGAGSIYVNNSGAIVLGAINTTNGVINVASSGALAADGPIASGGNGAITFTASGGDLTTAGVIAAGGSGDVNLSAAGNLNLGSSVSSGTGTLFLTGGTGVTGNASGILGGSVVNVTANSGNIGFAGVSSGAVGGTTLTASGISLQGFITTLGALTVQNSGTYLVSGPVNLSGGLDQTGAGPVALDSSINSRSGDVQFASSITIGSSAAASIATSGGDIIISQNITGSGSASSLALSSGAGNINLQAADNLGTLNVQTSGTLSLEGNLSANNLLTTSVTGNVLVAGANVNISTADSSVDFSHATGINGLNAGTQSLAVNSGAGNVILPAVGQTASLKGLTVNGGTITLANVTTSGGQSYTGTIRLGGNLASLTNGGVTVNGDLALLSDASVSTAGGGNISINGDVDGAHAFVLTTPSGQVALGGSVGGNTALTSLSVNSTTAGLGSVTTSGTQSYQSGTARLAGVLNSRSGAVNFGGVLNIGSASVIQADSIGFNGGASSVRGNTTLTLLPETNGLAVNIGGSGSGLTLDNTAMNGYNGELYIGTGSGPGAPLYITSPAAVLAGNVTVNGSLSLGSSSSLLLAGMGNLYLNSGTLTANTVTLIAGSQGSVMRNPGALHTRINANTAILVSGAQIGLPGQELNVQTSGTTPQVQIATGSVQSYLNPPTLPVVIGPAATIANAIAAQLGLFIQANSQVTSIGQQIVALAQAGGLLESGFVDISLFQNISLYNISGQGITLPFDQCQLPNNQLCNQQPQ